MIIGCGGVASVAIHKCCQNSDVFTEIMIASRTVSKCDALKEKLQGTTKTKITTAKVDADNVDELVALMESYKPDAVLNVALPYQDLTIMDACLKAGVNYIDTANYEPEDTDDPEWRAIYEKRCKDEGFTAYFDYSWQWAYKKKFEDAGLTALLGSGFDPGVTQAYCAYAQKHLFDELEQFHINVTRMRVLEKGLMTPERSIGKSTKIMYEALISTLKNTSVIPLYLKILEMDARAVDSTIEKITPLLAKAFFMAKTVGGLHDEAISKCYMEIWKKIGRSHADITEIEADLKRLLDRENCRNTFHESMRRSIRKAVWAAKRRSFCC